MRNLITPLLAAGLLSACAWVENLSILTREDTSATRHYTPSQIVAHLSDHDAQKHKPPIVRAKSVDITASGTGAGWFSDSKGPLFYDLVTGDFMVETEVAMRRLDGSSALPEGNFSSAGLLIRDPSSSFGNETWVMYNIGYQAAFWGHEVKATRPVGAHRHTNPIYNDGYRSLSTLHSIPHGNTGRNKLRLARIGDEIRFYYQENGKWKERDSTPQAQVFGNGTQVPVAGIVGNKFRPSGLGFPDEVQVGLIVNPGIDGNNLNIEKRDSYAAFSYLSIRPIKRFDEALR